MSAGIRVTVRFSAPAGCPVADLAARSGQSISDLATSVADGTSPPTTEFLVDAETVPDDYERAPVFAYANRHLYRVTHAADCPCALLGSYGIPVDRYFASGTDLELVFHADDFERLQTVVGDLRESFPTADIRRMVRESETATTRDAVFVDRGRLTDRQLEVVRTAHEMGFFDQPRAANATDVADALDLSPSTVSEHLQAAQSKLFGDILESDR